MPYTAKGKCVYRKDTGKKIGCTKGSVKKYLAALHANVKDVNESEEFDWVKDVLRKDIWVKFDEIKKGDYVIYKKGEAIQEPKKGGFWQVVGFETCRTYNPMDWSVVTMPCVRLQSIKDHNGQRYLTGENITVTNKPEEFKAYPINFKIVDKSDWLRERGWKVPVNESEDEFDWVELPELPENNDFISSVKYALEGSLYHLHLYTTGHLIIDNYFLVNIVELRKGDQTLFRKGLEYFTPENVKKEFDDVFTSIKLLGPGLSSKMERDYKLYFDAYELLKDLLPKDVNESEDDFEWAKDIVSTPPLIYRDKEILIDIQGLNKEELKKLYDIILPYAQTGSSWFINHEGEKIIWNDNLKCFENMLRDGVGKRKSISLHCGLEDNDYLPLKGAICCLNGTYDDEPSYSKENIIPINAREIIGSTINESEWFEDVVNEPILLKVEELEIGDIVIPTRFAQEEFIVTGKGTSVKMLHAPTHWVTLKRNTKANTGGVFIEHDSEIGKACRFELVHREDAINESEEDSELFWAEDLLKGLQDSVDITDKLDIMEELPVGSILQVRGYQDEMELDMDEVMLIDKAKNQGYDSTYYLFKLKYEKHSDGSEMTHCGNNSEHRKICECRESTDDDDLSQTEVGKCWWIELKKQDKVIYYPNRMGLSESKKKKPLLTEGRYDTITRKVVKDIMKAVTEGDSDSYNLPWDVSHEQEYEQENLSFSLELEIIRTEEVESFVVRTAIAEYEEDEEDNIIMMSIFIGPNFNQQKLEKLFYKLQEDIRHEIEHFTQEGPNRIEDRPIYKGNTANLKTVYGHHKNVIEVPALVHGFYRRAKLEKRPIDEIMMDDLDSEIEKGLLTKNQAQKLLTLWIDYAKKNLPAAIYKEN